ncbi:MAG: hypothetical protein ACJ8J7_14535, partial [Sulfurifustaceae bacterium]
MSAARRVMCPTAIQRRNPLEWAFSERSRGTFMGEARLFDVVLLAGAAVVFVPLAKRAGVGSVLGYLGAGV